MSRPKFQRREVQVWSSYGLLPGEEQLPPGLVGPSPWDTHRIWHQAALTRIRLPDAAQPYVDVDEAVQRRLGRLRHQAYLKRTGGNLRTEVEEVVHMWSCCGQEELLNEVRYDRHGDLRPEDEAIINALRYYHRCADA